MKKIFTLVIVSFLSVLAVQAQKVVINKTDGSQVIYQADEVKDIQFAPLTLADTYAGSYKGFDNVNVMFSYKSSEEVVYKVTANGDGTINLIVPEVTYKKTVMGNLTLGTYTIKNIPYDETQKAFVKAYKDDNIKFHFIKKKDDGSVISDQEYTFNNEKCKVVISKEADGKLKVENTYQLGRMPFPISGSFMGTKQ